jgi:hypothetical protein
MAVIVLRFDDFKPPLDNRPKHCPYCGSEDLQGWGFGEKTVQDVRPELSEYHRYRCNACRRTFRHYSAGVDRTHLTQRIRKVAGMAWALGLSAREVVEVFKECEIELNYVTVWREGNDLVARQKDHFGPNHPGRYSIDKEFLKIKTRGIGTSFIIELGLGKTLLLGRMEEVNYRRILAWLEPIIKDLDIQVSLMGTDKLFEKNPM